jgi:hypothetical protein
MEDEVSTMAARASAVFLHFAALLACLALPGNTGRRLSYTPSRARPFCR